MEDTRFGMDYIKKVRGKSDPRAGTESSKGGGALGRFTWGSKKSLGSQKVAKRKPKKKTRANAKMAEKEAGPSPEAEKADSFEEETETS